MAGNPYESTNTAGGQAQQRNDFLYGDAQDASGAMRNAMLDSGFNPYLANPFIKKLLQAGNGAYLSGLVNNSGMNAGAAEAAGGQGSIMGKYLQDALKNGSVFSGISQAKDAIPGLTDRLTESAHDMANGKVSEKDINPFLKLLGTQMGSASGMGGLLSALNGPLLGGQLGKAYQSQVGDVMDSKERQQASDPDTYTPGKGRNFWEYVFKNIDNGSNPIFKTSSNGAPAGGSAAPGANATGSTQLPASAQAAANAGPVPGQASLIPVTPPDSLQVPPAAGQPGSPDEGLGQYGPDVPAGFAQNGSAADAISKITPQQIQEIAGQTGQSPDSVTSILSDMAKDGGTTAVDAVNRIMGGLGAGKLRQAMGAGGTSVQAFVAGNPYLQRLFNLPPPTGGVAGPNDITGGISVGGGA